MPDEEKQNVKDNVIPVMEELLQDLRQIKSETFVNKVVQQGWCLFNIAVFYSYIGEYQRFAEINESAIELMSNEMGDKAETCRVYGLYYHIAGAAYERMNQYEKAVEMYQKALDVYKKTTDWESEEDEKSNMNLVINNIEKVTFVFDITALIDRRGPVKMHKKEIVDRAMTSSLTADDITNLAHELYTKKQYILSIYMSFCAGKMQKLEGDQAANYLQQRVEDVMIVVEEMPEDEKKQNVKDNVIPVMEELLQDLRQIKSETFVNKVVQQGWCLLNIAMSYSYIGEYQRFAEINESAIELMSNEMGDKAETCRVYGLCHNNAGVAYCIMDQYHKAAEMFQKALDVYKKTTDWMNVDEKYSSMNDTSKNLENTREHEDRSKSSMNRMLEKANERHKYVLSHEEEIKPEGGSIELPGLKLTFQPNSFQKSTTVKITLEFNPTKHPIGYLPIAPFLDCKFSEPLLKSVLVEIQAICSFKKCAESKNIRIKILHQLEGSNHWETIHTLPLPDSNVISFQCNNFSSLVAVLSSILSTVKDFFYPQYMIFTVKGLLYASSHGNFSIIFLKHPVAESTISDRFAQNQMVLVGNLTYGSVVVNVNDNLTVKLRLDEEDSSKFHFASENKFTLNISDEFLTTILEKQYSTAIKPYDENQGSGRITIYSELFINGTLFDKEQSFNVDWKKTESDTSTTSKTMIVNQNFNTCAIGNSANLYQQCFGISTDSQSGERQLRVPTAETTSLITACGDSELSVTVKESSMAIGSGAIANLTINSTSDKGHPKEET